MVFPRAQTYVIFAVLGALLAYIMWQMHVPIPVLTKSETDIDNTIIGDSATDDHSVGGPAYMSANWAWPMPLAFWNPVTTVRQ